MINEEKVESLTPGSASDPRGGVLVDTRPESRKRSQGPADDDDLTIDDILEVIRTALEDKKGQEVRIIDVAEHCDYMEYLVVASGLSDTHNRALADNVMSELARYGIIRDDLQGYRRGDWILIDYDVLVVHLFLPALREFYRLEELWASGEEIKAA
ncbi:ribosome silencing factor [bacterium]|nr:ribosome silencing factor [bacterium]